MIPVKQTKFSNKGGNCFEACIASILEVDLEEVPENDSRDDRSFNLWCRGRLAEWLRERGLVLYGLSLHEDAVVSEIPDVPDTFWIALIDSGGATISHAVVYEGTTLVWDPFPMTRSPGRDRDKEPTIQSVYVFSPVEPQRWPKR